jgi:hypothetical protein
MHEAAVAQGDRRLRAERPVLTRIALAGALREAGVPWSERQGAMRVLTKAAQEATPEAVAALAAPVF